MKLYSKSFVAKQGMIKKAQGFYPLHHYDESIETKFHNTNFDNLSERQNQLLDIVFKEQGGKSSNQMLDLVMNKTAYDNIYSSQEDKDLLIKAWESSKSISRAENQEGNRIRISSEFNNYDLNRLKSAGLLTGAGSDVRLTKMGRAVLMKFFLNEGECSLNKASFGIKKMIKIAKKTNYYLHVDDSQNEELALKGYIKTVYDDFSSNKSTLPDPQRGEQQQQKNERRSVEKASMGLTDLDGNLIVRDKDGNWVRIVAEKS